jgi:hypothetical protein
MKIEICGMTDYQKEIVLHEIYAIGANWQGNGYGGVIVESGAYDMQGFTMWLDSLNILWSEQ